MTDHQTETTPETADRPDPTPSVTDDPDAAAIADQMRVTDPDRDAAFDARQIRTEHSLAEARAAADHARFTPAALDDKRRLAALYYGGCPASPAGMTQQAIADWLGVTTSTVSRRMLALGIHAPEPVRRRRAALVRNGSRPEETPATEPPDPAQVVARRRLSQARARARHRDGGGG